MILVIGAGYMAREYCNVLSALNKDYTVVCNSEASALKIEQDYSVKAHSGGLDKYLSNHKMMHNFAIVCVPVELLASSTLALLQVNVENILIEKPGALSTEELEKIDLISKEKSINTYIGYNRRFYQSVIAAEEAIKQDGGLVGFDFEITEWANVVENESCTSLVKEKWILSNTSHVIDTAFFLGGQPSEMSSYTSGGNSWHPNAANFTGAGKTDKGVVFSYCGYWDGPGRWALEMATSKRRLVFKPFEKLQVQMKGTVKVEPFEGIDYSLDEKFKPGLYLQTQAFLNGDFSRFVPIEEQIKNFSLYNQIANYA